MDPILRDFRHSFDTERLTIRCPLPGDGAELNAAVLESLDELRPWMPFAQRIPTVEESEILMRRAQAHFLLRENLWLLLFLKGSHTLVGSSGLHNLDWSIPSFELGYWVRTRFAHQGYITEAGAAITRWAFEELGARRVQIRCDARNVRSAAVARRLGYVYEGMLHHEACDVTGNGLRDTLCFARFPENDSTAEGNSPTD